MTNKVKLSDYLSKEELTHFSTANDLRAWGIFVTTWGMIAGAFAMAIIWPNPLTFLLAILILGGRQLGLGVINHDCAHYAFFSNKTVNDFVGHWLAGSAINTSVYAYRTYHLKHHKYAGTPDDPDKWMVKDYPITRERLKRKLMRDTHGPHRHSRYLEAAQSVFVQEEHAVVFVSRFAAGYVDGGGGALGIPSVVGGEPDGLSGDRPHTADWGTWRGGRPRQLRPARKHGHHVGLLVGTPVYRADFVNFHLEHHHFAAVPGYNLPKLHALLRSRGYYDGYDCIAKGYIDVLRRASSKPAEGAPNAAQAA